jgi:hypothetical protein
VVGYWWHVAASRWEESRAGPARCACGSPRAARHGTGVPRAHAQTGAPRRVRPYIRYRTRRHQKAESHYKQRVQLHMRTRIAMRRRRKAREPAGCALASALGAAAPVHMYRHTDRHHTAHSHTREVNVSRYAHAVIPSPVLRRARDRHAHGRGQSQAKDGLAAAEMADVANEEPPPPNGDALRPLNGLSGLSLSFSATPAFALTLFTSEPDAPIFMRADSASPSVRAILSGTMPPDCERRMPERAVAALPGWLPGSRSGGLLRRERRLAGVLPRASPPPPHLSPHCRGGEPERPPIPCAALREPPAEMRARVLRCW